MGEVYGLVFVAMVVAGIGGYIITKYVIPKKPQLLKGGKWRRTQETVTDSSGTRVRILLVREFQGRETGRLPVCEIKSDDPQWNNKYMKAIADADTKRAELDAAEQ